MFRKSPLLAVPFALILAACQQQAAPPAATSAPAPKVAAAPTADSTGIPECDNYLTKYQACVESKVPESARAGFKQSLDQTRASWRTVLAAPGGKETMAAACKQASESAKTSMSSFGCTDF